MPPPMGHASEQNSQRRNPFLQPLPRPNWKGKRPDIPNNSNSNRQARKRNLPGRLPRRKIGWNNDQNLAYQPPRLQDLQFQNRVKATSYFPKRFNDRVPPNGPRDMASKGSRAPGAPLNTTSYLMRAKKSGGIASLVSPMPPTPAVIPTPVLSPLLPYRGLVDEVNNEWGVNGYGSMNGLIRLRSSECGREDGDSESDIEQGAHAQSVQEEGVHVQSVQQLEQRLDQDLSRFVMTYPSRSPHTDGQNLLETRMEDQDSHIAHLEEENVTLKERLLLMQQEVEDLRRRMQLLEGGAISDEQAEACSERSTADASCL